MTFTDVEYLHIHVGRVIHLLGCCHQCGSALFLVKEENGSRKARICSDILQTALFGLLGSWRLGQAYVGIINKCMGSVRWLQMMSSGAKVCLEYLVSLAALSTYSQMQGPALACQGIYLDFELPR